MTGRLATHFSNTAVTRYRSRSLTAYRSLAPSGELTELIISVLGVDSVRPMGLELCCTTDSVILIFSGDGKGEEMEKECTE